MQNRRREDPAERRRRRRAALRRWAAALAKGALCLGAAAALYAGGKGLWTYLTESPAFAIQRIEIEGLQRTGEAELRAHLGIHPGQNIFRVDLDRATADLQRLPWIHTATLRRHYPQGLRVTVVEREARALVDLGHLYLVDASGEVFKRAMPGDPLDLPVITGLSRDAWRAGRAAEKERLLSALEALAIVEAHPIARRHLLSELHLGAKAGGLILYLGERAMEVRLGEGDLSRKLDRLSRVMAEAERRGQRLEVVRLDNRTRPGWIAARLRGAEGREGTPRSEAPRG